MEDRPPEELRHSVQPPSLRPEEEFHAFIAHSSADCYEFSRHVTSCLEELGFACCHADKDFLGGGTVIQNIDTSIEKSRRVIVLITKEFLKSDWFVFEIANSISKGNTRKERVMIPVLHDVLESEVPNYVKEITYIESQAPDSWDRLVRAITETIPLSTALPAGNVAHGLAWGYYYGFLSIILPSMQKRISDSRFSTESIPFINKVIIILPESCYCPGDIGDVDSFVAHQGSLSRYATRAGNIKREYKSPVYKVTDPDSSTKEYLMVLEFATPLMILYEMEQGAASGLRKADKIVQMKLLKDKLQEILDCTGYKKQALLVTYKDKYLYEQQEPHRLASLLAAVAKEELNLNELDEMDVGS